LKKAEVPNLLSVKHDLHIREKEETKSEKIITKNILAAGCCGASSKGKTNIKVTWNKCYYEFGEPIKASINIDNSKVK